MLSRGGFNETLRIRGMKIQTALQHDRCVRYWVNSFVSVMLTDEILGPRPELRGSLIDFLSSCRFQPPFNLAQNVKI
jgi:hypothetical protein